MVVVFPTPLTPTKKTPLAVRFQRAARRPRAARRHLSAVPVAPAALDEGPHVRQLAASCSIRQFGNNCPSGLHANICHEKRSLKILESRFINLFSLAKVAVHGPFATGLDNPFRSLPRKPDPAACVTG